MKVTGVGPGQKTDRTKRTEKTSGATSGFRDALVEPTDSVDDARGVDGLSSLAGVDTLLTLQSVGGETEREARRRQIRRGEEILDQLEELRHGILLGSLSQGVLEALANKVRTSREECVDPRLGAILDEIELRAEVELAKLSCEPAFQKVPALAG
ncbi:MAG TPA: flagellar assembly protein FliX [Rhodospirillaceae bacterium]|nr:flagellar assembly protein FliX [Rhodospirillaceae bacterium]